MISRIFNPLAVLSGTVMRYCFSQLPPPDLDGAANRCAASTYFAGNFGENFVNQRICLEDIADKYSRNQRNQHKEVGGMIIATALPRSLPHRLFITHREWFLLRMEQHFWKFVAGQ